MEIVLRQIFKTFYLTTGIELGISENTQYLHDKLWGLTNLSRNTELFHKYKLEDARWWRVQHYEQILDITTFFEYFQPEYDMAVISCNIYDDCLLFFERLTRDRNPLILSRWDMGTKRDYRMRAFEIDGEKSYLYYRDQVQDW